MAGAFDDLLPSEKKSSGAFGDLVPTAKKSSFTQNLAGSVLGGAGDIGSTLFAPIDWAARKLNGGQPVNVGGYDVVGQDRRAGIEGALQSVGVDTNSDTYKYGKVGTQILGTAGAGGVIANGALRAAPLLAKFAPSVANLLTKAAPAIQSGGLTLGAGAPANVVANIAARTAGGAVNGAASAGLVNPDDAGMGALIGGALPGAVKMAGLLGSGLHQVGAGITNNALGMFTGTGSEAVRTAYQSGKSGATSFLDNMRGNVPMTNVLDSAKDALGKMRIDKGNQYRSGMIDISADKSIIDFAPIDKAASAIQTMGSYKGQVINKNSAGVVDELSGLVNQWKGLNPAEYHTPEGLDALKQAIGDVRDTTNFGTGARVAADKAYNAVKGEIVSQAPTYSKVMKDYSEASTVVSEVEKALSLGGKTSADTAMRKMQSLMRNNVNTNYGNRLSLAKTLEDNGADLMAPIAGQAMNSWTPRGLAGLGTTGSLGTAAMFTSPWALAGLPATSPRLVGEMAYGLGAANRGVANAGSAAASRMNQMIGRGNNSGLLSLEDFAPFMATGSVLAANQR